MSDDQLVSTADARSHQYLGVIVAREGCNRSRSFTVEAVEREIVAPDSQLPPDINSNAVREQDWLPGSGKSGSKGFQKLQR